MNSLGNIDIIITEASSIPGARVMDITRGEQTRKCLVIPVDNHVGTCIDAYKRKDGKTGLDTWQDLSDIQLHFTGIAFKQVKNGRTHGIKPKVSKEKLEHMTEDQVYNIPWVGNVRTWKPDAVKEDIGDLPLAEQPKGW